MRFGRFGHRGHWVFPLGYGAVGAATALMLAALRPQTDPVVIVMAGAQVVVAGGLIHEAVTRHRQHRKIVERLARMRQAYEDLVELILKSRTGGTAPVPEPTPTPTVTPAVTPTVTPTVTPGDDSAPAQRPAPPRPLRTVATAKPAPVPLPPVPPTPTPDDVKLTAEVREALTEHRVEAFLQPIVTVPGRKPKAFEVLARLRAADDSLITPDRFLPVCEREDLLATLDLQMLSRVTQLIRDTDRHRHTVSFFCNLSRPTLSDQTFMAEYLGGGGDRHGLRDKLVFEMTQNDLTAELLASVSTVGELAAIGFRFSMDRLDHLAVNPDLLASRGVRYLKVGYALLSAAERRGELDNLRRQLNAQSIELIVEKVETERQNQELELLGLESAQGFLFGEPRPSKRSAA